MRVVEVDRERGRIGLRLADDPDIAGKSVEELAGVGTGGGGGGGGRPRNGARAARGSERAPRPRAGLRGRDGERGSGRPRHGATAADRPRGCRPSTASPRSTPACRVVTERMPSVRSVALGFWIATGSAAEHERARRGSRTCSSTCCSAAPSATAREEIDQIFDAMGAEINAGTDKEATSLYTRVLDRHLERAFDVMSDMVWRPRFGELEAEREVVLEEIAMYEDDPQDRVFDVLGEAVFGSHPLGRAGDRHAPRSSAAATREQLRGLPRRALPPREHRDRGRRARSTTTRSWRMAARRRIARRARAAGAQPARASGARRAAAAARASARRVRFLREGHRAVPRLPRRRRAGARRRAPLRAARARRRARRDLLLAAVPGGARAPRAGLLGVLLLEPVRAHGRGRAVRGHAPGEPRARRWRSSPRELRALRARTRPARRS